MPATLPPAERRARAERLHQLQAARISVAQEYEHAIARALRILSVLRDLDRQAGAIAEELGVAFTSSEHAVGRWMARQFQGTVPVFGPRPGPELDQPLATLLPPPPPRRPEDRPGS